MNKEYVLITGATGFIGFHVVDELLLNGSYNIIAIVRKDKNYKNVAELKRKGVILVEGNFFDKNLVKYIFRHFPIKNVIHIAALRGIGVATRKEYLRVNVQGTEVLLEESFSRRVKKFIFFSSVGVFGTIPIELPAGLKTQLNGDNDYHNSKILAEERVLNFINKGLDAYIIRPTITYGFGDNGFGMTLIGLVKKRKLFLPLKNITIHLLNVNSLAALASRIIKSDSLSKRIFIVADEAPIPLKELVDLIHLHYYKKTYPQFLRLPSFAFRLLSLLFLITNNDKWLTKILLISKSWYYDISETVRTFSMIPAKTKDSFIRSMCI